MVQLRFLRGGQRQFIQRIHKGFPASRPAPGRLAQMPCAKTVAQLQCFGALDQKSGTQLGAFGDEQPAKRLCGAGALDCASHRQRDVHVQVGKVGFGLFGTAACGQIVDDHLQRRLVVQALQFTLKQVLSDHKTCITGQRLERRMGLDCLVELFVRCVGDLIQSLRTQGRSVLIKRHRSLPC
ncbi:CO or xanthine dehydrogenase [Pseudomonas syringae pv. actinidiae]|uniref:CO or xanthine dehydrogenase n=1 Tax=Pseudomonas syringae pv. actinidiae TaxID=103796 RepID=A0A2V0QHF9_PSESF|nr:CO or xanthine dehydrogenase [Pseudomonas syringae pv. actinidiae]